MAVESILFAQLDAPASAEPIIDTALLMWRGFMARLPHFIAAALVVFIGFGLSKPLGRAVCRIGRRGAHENLAEVLRRLVRAAIVLLTFLIAAVIVFPTFRPGELIAGLGITSVAIGFAFKDILQNFFAGILILWREPFKIGDEIRSGEFEGLVEDINVRSTRIRTYDGERAVLPNGDVYTRAILVRTAYDKRRVVFTVGIGYPDSLENARATVHSVLARTEGVLQDPGPWVYVTELAPSSVNLTVYFWVRPQQRNVLLVRDRVVTGIKLALDAAGIDMPYPHAVISFENMQANEPAHRDHRASSEQSNGSTPR
jgi:small conductance mechanosensitive channel